ncbi:MAG TPA: SDR family oxidoreductase [Chryseolinea sp.]|nr:SDR family oxidoreductase [Chryseolinea sp.]HPH47722.1 SDR family oxidoreductase [Chryseolinea sp.]HPM30168.1 SDR family oxidoreductase [Chryseolinea sp.]
MVEEKSGLFSLNHKVIIVTGGTGVLGSSFVNAIVRQKGKVVLLGIDKEIGDRRAEEINNNGGDAISIYANVLEEPQLINAREKIMATYGRIDGLVNAAGGNVPEGVLPPAKDVFDLNIEGMKKAMVLNLWGTIIPVQVFGPEMAKSGGGSIVNISSVSSKRALTRVLGYSMGKAAVDCYTKWFAVEMANRYGDAIRMNSIMPGFFLTEQNRTLLTNADGSLTERGHSIISHTPFKRFGHPEELVGALIWLLSDASKFITGMDIGVDGGFTINSGV